MNRDLESERARAREMAKHVRQLESRSKEAAAMEFYHVSHNYFDPRQPKSSLELRRAQHLSPHHQPIKKPVDLKHMLEIIRIERETHTLQSRFKEEMQNNWPLQYMQKQMPPSWFLSGTKFKYDMQVSAPVRANYRRVPSFGQPFMPISSPSKDNKAPSSAAIINAALDLLDTNDDHSRGNSHQHDEERALALQVKRLKEKQEARARIKHLTENDLQSKRMRDILASKSEQLFGQTAHFDPLKHTLPLTTRRSHEHLRDRKDSASVRHIAPFKSTGMWRGQFAKRKGIRRGMSLLGDDLDLPDTTAIDTIDTITTTTTTTEDRPPSNQQTLQPLNFKDSGVDEIYSGLTRHPRLGGVSSENKLGLGHVVRAITSIKNARRRLGSRKGERHTKAKAKAEAAKAAEVVKAFGRNVVSTSAFQAQEDMATHNVGKSLVWALEQHAAITDIDLSGHKLGKKGCEQLKHALTNVEVERLALNNCALKDRDILQVLEALQHKVTLKDLSLSRNNLSDQSALALSTLLEAPSNQDQPGIARLNLEWNGLGGRALEVLSVGLNNNESLRELNLGHNNFGYRSDFGPKHVGVEEMCLAIAGHPNIKLLFLDHCRLTFEPTTAKALQTLFQDNTSLHSVHLTGNGVWVTPSGLIEPVLTKKNPSDYSPPKPAPPPKVATPRDKSKARKKSKKKKLSPRRPRTPAQEVVDEDERINTIPGSKAMPRVMCRFLTHPHVLHHKKWYQMSRCWVSEKFVDCTFTYIPWVTGPPGRDIQLYCATRSSDRHGWSLIVPFVKGNKVDLAIEEDRDRRFKKRKAVSKIQRIFKRHNIVRKRVLHEGKNVRLMLKEFLKEYQTRKRRQETKMTPLAVAVSRGEAWVVASLLDVGADPDDAGDEMSGSPLVLAAYGGYMDIMKMLLEAGAGLHRVNVDNNTALHCACERGHVKMAVHLLLHGASNKITNHEGKRPIEAAPERKRVQIEALLLKEQAALVAFFDRRRHLCTKKGLNRYGVYNVVRKAMFTREMEKQQELYMAQAEKENMQQSVTPLQVTIMVPEERVYFYYLIDKKIVKPRGFACETKIVGVNEQVITNCPYLDFHKHSDHTPIDVTQISQFRMAKAQHDREEEQARREHESVNRPHLSQTL